MEHKSLITELTQGKEMAIQLRTHLQPSSSSPEACFFLTEMIQSSFEKALLLLNYYSNPSDSIMAADPSPKVSFVEEESTKNKRQSSKSSDVSKKR